MQVVKASTKLYRDRDLTAPVETELLIGEIFDEDYVDFGWVHGKARLDGYQGYVRLLDVHPGERTTTHRVSAVRTIGYAAPDLKSSAIEWLSINSLGCIEEEVNGFTRFNGIWVPTQHIAALDKPTPNYVEVARGFIGTPYLWGGRDANHGVDCSGLVQQALLATGRVVPRDSGPQSERIGVLINPEGGDGIGTGDFVFWKGHVGIVTGLDGRGNDSLIHATADHMRVVEEPLELVIKRRRAQGGGESLCYRRILPK
ncbi:MAG: NLP/P60 family lipoprotein [Parcubacteria bacterium C7867-001]|nr:MAG: NLP/P60 family lipoprotein [Parcubacteria bacterium C7867-001]